MAIIKENNTAVVEILIKAGADVNIVDEVSYYQAPQCNKYVLLW